MYEEREDSAMLADAVMKHAKGKVLDVGTGKGIQAVTAAKKSNVQQVFAADIDKDAIDYCKKNIQSRKIIFKVSDLFSAVEGKFDTIIFNPPYLPEERFAKTEDKALYGGKEGFETIERFFNQVDEYLDENGAILLVFSSLTQKKKVDEIIKKKGFLAKLLEKKHFFFEDLFVYLIRRR